MPHELLYFDYQASTPIAEEVLALMTEIYAQEYGNPHSAEHAFGWQAHEACEVARRQVAEAIGARRASDIIFTSGATEANNLAIKGMAEAHVKAGGKRRRIVINPIEHKCALEAAKSLQKHGFTIDILPMDSSGVVKVADIKKALGEDVLMLVLQSVNNEIGTIQPITEAADLCLQAGVLLHCDAAQSVGRVAINVNDHAGIASMSLSGHKIYGPKGVGALYIRGRPAVDIVPLFNGGGQERGLRSGTLPAPLVAGLGLACEIAGKRLQADNSDAAKLRGLFLDGLTKRGVQFSLNGDSQNRIPANININLPSVASVDFFQRIKGIAVSAGSACSSGDSSFSHVLQAIGTRAEDSSTHLRLTIGRPTTEAHIKTAIDAIADVVRS